MNNYFPHDNWPLGEKSKFRRIKFLHMAILHIYMRYQHHPIKIVGQVRETIKKRQNTTLFPRYLTFGGKNQNSAALRFCIWPFYTFLCDTSTIQWKLLDEFAKVWKKRPKTTSFSPAVTLTLTRWPWDLCPDIHVSKVNIPCKFWEIEIMGK